MSQPPSEIRSAASVLRLQEAVHRLTVDAIEAPSVQALIFHMLNRSVVLAPYRRAVLWNLEGRRPKVLGVSGQSDPVGQAPLVREWTEFMQDLPREALQSPRILDASSFPDGLASWQRLEERVPNTTLLWVPLCVKGRPVAGLWFERAGGVCWSEEEQAFLQRLGEAYSAVWASRYTRQGGIGRHSRRVGTLLVVAALVYLLGFREIHLRVIAPCEVAPRDPFIVAAPFNGVVDTMAVAPDQVVAKGDLLFEYEGSVAREELNVVRQEVRVIRTQLERARVMALELQEARAEMEELEHRLSREQIRLRLAEEQVSKLRVHAEQAGLVVMDPAHTWRGRAVRIGERVLSLVDPEDSLLRLRIPEGDNLSFKPGAGVQVFLNVRPDESLPAELDYVARVAQPGPDGAPYFFAEAHWRESATPPRLGLEGTAVLRGQRVPVGYWLVRKPLAWFRRTVGW